MHMCGLPHPPPRAVPPDARALVLICQCPVHVPRGTPATAPALVQVCIKRGYRYTPVDTARLDLGDHRATLTPPGGTPLVIATPMVTKATFDKARGGLVLVHSAPGAQQLREAEWKGWSVSWKSYVQALQPTRPVGFKVLGGLDSPQAHRRAAGRDRFPDHGVRPHQARPACRLGVCQHLGTGCEPPG